MDIHDRLKSYVGRERACLARILELLGRLDESKAVIDAGYSSLFAYCVEELGYSEDEASRRLQAARTVRRFPEFLDDIEHGRLHLSGLLTIAPMLRLDNVSRLRAAAAGKPVRVLRELLAAESPRVDLPQSIRRLPRSKRHEPGPAPARGGTVAADAAPPPDRPAPQAARPRTPAIEPLAQARYALRLTLDAATKERLDRAADRLSHRVPDRDLSAVLSVVLDFYLDRAPVAAGRGIPAATAREVWTRDRGRCTYRSEQGRVCDSTRFVQIDHVVPRAAGGGGEAENLRLLCGAHNRAAWRAWAKAPAASGRPLRPSPPSG